MNNDIKHDDGKTFAIISYFTWVGLLVSFVLNRDKQFELASFHIRQMLGLTLTVVCVGLLNVIPIIGQIIFLISMVLFFIMWVSGLIKAINGDMKPMPVLGGKYQEWFRSV